MNDMIEEKDNSSQNWRPSLNFDAVAASGKELHLSQMASSGTRRST